MQKLYDLVPEIGEKTGMIDSYIDVNYPHIAKKLLLLWGEPECLMELDNLLNYSYSPDRPNRQGFPLQVMTELFIILEKHHKEFPKVKADIIHRIEDPWA